MTHLLAFGLKLLLLLLHVFKESGKLVLKLSLLSLHSLDLGTSPLLVKKLFAFSLGRLLTYQTVMCLLSFALDFLYLLRQRLLILPLHSLQLVIILRNHIL